MNLTDIVRQACLLFHRRVYPDQSFIDLQTAEPVTINLAGFMKGIDNVHLDVHLSPQFQFHAKKFIAAMIDQDAGHTIGSVKKTGPTRQQWEHFQIAYTKMINAAIHHAKSSKCPPLVQLAQIAAIKFLQEQVQNELVQLRNILRNAIAAGGATVDSTIMELVQQKIWLSRNRAQLNYKVLRRLLAPIVRAEEGELGELRYSLMGMRWSLPKEFFSNPLLQIDSPFDDVFLSQHYVLLKQGQSQDNDATYSYAAIDRVLPQLFRSFPARNEIEAALTRAEGLLAKAEVELSKINKKLSRAKKYKVVEQIKLEKELVERLVAAVRSNHDNCLADYLHTHYVWAEEPSNVDLLFNDRIATEQINEARKSKNAALLATWKEQRRFQRSLLSIVERYFRRTGLLRQVVAAYEMVPLVKDFAGLLSSGEIHQFVLDRTARNGLLEQARSRNVNAQPLNIVSLTQLARRIGNLSRQEERGMLIRFLKDFLTFRRDLNYFQNLQQVSATITLRNDPKELRLSQANRTLYEFYGTGEKRTSTKTVLNHVILKADIRGSTAMVQELRKHSLNPASHFSSNFYNPLNMVLKAFGASKVFIEGDAVILSMVEHDEVLESRFSVARMCGVGEQMLNIVQAQNAACRENGLPELEIGIGIVYCEEPPSYLFDGDHPIMISAAIAMADRLSSCSWMLRKERPVQKHDYTNVDIYEIPEGDRRKGEKGEVYLRYNLNGIELDKSGFVKLQSELTLQEVNLVLPGDDISTSFFYGRYPDLKGTLRRVVVRQGRIRLFDRQHPQFGDPTADVFYEVVVTKDLLTQVEEAINYLESMTKS